MKPKTKKTWIAGDRVQWDDSVLDFSGKRKKIVVSGVVYRVDMTRVAVLPDLWAAEGHTEGLLKEPGELKERP